MEKGYVHVYTGNGKGKTTAMLGLALRARGAGLRVYIGQFVKHIESSEIKAIKKYLPDIKTELYGTGLILGRGITQKDRAAAGDGFLKVTEAVMSGGYDIVMLDEINAAVDLGLIAAVDVVRLIREKPEHVELVLTGRNAAAEIVDAADLVSEVTEVKHYYREGVMARDGIEK